MKYTKEQIAKMLHEITPGGWIVRNDKGNQGPSIVPEFCGYAEIAVITCIGLRDSNENAAFIAAAPDIVRQLYMEIAVLKSEPKPLTPDRIASLKADILEVSRSAMASAQEGQRMLIAARDEIIQLSRDVDALLATAKEDRRVLTTARNTIVQLNKEIDALKAEIERLRTINPVTDDGWDRVVSASYNDDGGSSFRAELEGYRARINSQED